MNQFDTIFIDIDGTLRNDKKDISEYTKRVLFKIQNMGINVILCSGRSREYVKNISNELKLSSYIIASNGADVFSYKDNKSIYTSSIDKKSLKALYNIAIESDLKMCIDTNLGQYTNCNLNSKTVYFSNDLLSKMNTHKTFHLHFFDTDEKKMNDILNYVKNIPEIKIGFDNNLYFYNSNYYIFINSFNSNKGDGIEKLCKSEHLDINKTICFGDDENDISMFEISNYSIAVDNAIDDLKKISDEITKSNNQDGVAYWLEKNIIKNNNDENF